MGFSRTSNPAIAVFSATTAVPVRFETQWKLAKETPRGYLGGTIQAINYPLHALLVRMEFGPMSNSKAQVFASVMQRYDFFYLAMNAPGTAHASIADPLRTVAAGFTGGRRLPLQSFSKSGLKLGQFVSYENPRAPAFTVLTQIAGFYASGIIVDPPIPDALAAGTTIRIESAVGTLRPPDPQCFRFTQTLEGYQVSRAELITAAPQTFAFS